MKEPVLCKVELMQSTKANCLRTEIVILKKIQSCFWLNFSLYACGWYTSSTSSNDSCKHIYVPKTLCKKALKYHWHSLWFTKNDDISVLVCIYVLKQVGWKNRINISTAMEVNQRTIGLQMHAYSGNVPYKENMRVESLNVDSSSIKIEVSRNGRTHRLLELVFINYRCASILLPSRASMY